MDGRRGRVLRVRLCLPFRCLAQSLTPHSNGFSVPITCTCDEDNKFLSGCNKDLWTMSTCPQNNGMGSCKNPLRVPLGKQEPTPFFKPCEAKAYTYPSDDMAMSEGTCQDGRVTCCVGTAC